MTDIATYVSTAIGFLGLVIAYWQHRQRKQLEHVIRANNWFNYARSNNATGNIQLALTLYKEKHADSLSPEVIEKLAKADAFGQEVYKESVRQLHFSEPSFTKKDIERWVAEGKINDKGSPLFLQLSSESKE